MNANPPGVHAKEAREADRKLCEWVMSRLQALKTFGDLDLTIKVRGGRLSCQRHPQVVYQEDAV